MGGHQQHWRVVGGLATSTLLERASQLIALERIVRCRQLDRFGLTVSARNDREDCYLNPTASINQLDVTPPSRVLQVPAVLSA
jgi:hypothetical protein